MIARPVCRGAWVVCLLVAPACGEAGTGKNEDLRFVPLIVNAAWTYRVVEASDGSVWEKTQRVEATGTMSDVTGEVFTLVTEQSDGDRTVSFQRASPDGVIRYREESYKLGDLHQVESYAPSRLRVPLLGSVGDHTRETFREVDYDGEGRLIKQTDKTELWTLDSVGPIMVPAGSFARAFGFRRVGSKNTKRFWYVEGVGKVREEGSDQTEELTSYQLP